MASRYKGESSGAAGEMRLCDAAMINSCWWDSALTITPLRGEREPREEEPRVRGDEGSQGVRGASPVIGGL